MANAKQMRKWDLRVMSEGKIIIIYHKTWKDEITKFGTLKFLKLDNTKLDLDKSSFCVTMVLYLTKTIYIDFYYLLK